MRYIKSTALAVALGVSSTCAMAGIVVVTSAEGPEMELTRNQIADIFLGKTNRLPDGTPVIPFDQAEGTSLRNEFYMTIAGKSAAQIKAHWSKIIFTGRGWPPKEVGSSGEAKQLLIRNPRAIGYIDESAVDESVKVITISP